MSIIRGMTQHFRGFPKDGIRFLRALQKNNRRAWFQKRKATYLRTLKDPMDSLIVDISAELGAFAPEMLGSPKVSAYRIYRDTRFSANKAPYKTHVAAVFPRRGLPKHEGAGFYVHVAHDEVFAGGGLFRPATDDLQAVREYLAENHERFRSLIGAPRFRRLFGSISGERLIRVPRGFHKDHPAADLLRYKQFLASRAFDPAIATTPRFYPEIIRTMKALLPVIRFLNEPIVGRRNPGLSGTGEGRALRSRPSPQRTGSP